MKGERIVLLNEQDIPVYLKKENDEQVRYRLAFLNAILEVDYDLRKACTIFQVSLPTAYKWVNAWNVRGYEGIKHPFHGSDNPSGRPPQLDDFALDTLRILLDAKENWTTNEVRELIKETWGIHLSESQVRRILKNKLKMYFSKPYPHDYKRPSDAENQLSQALHNAVNSLNNKGIHIDKVAIGFVDEAHPNQNSNTARVWHFKSRGKVEKDSTHYNANVIGFYAIEGNSIQAFIPNSKTESICSFLEEIRNANKGYDAMIVVLDNFSSHHSKSVIELANNLNIELVYLPPYSPDLNPIEFIWKTIKRNLSLGTIESLSSLQEVVIDAWNAASRKCSYAKNWIEEFLGNFEYRELC